MQSIKTKLAELRVEVERARRRERDDASARVMKVITDQFHDDLEPNICAMSARLLAEQPTDDDLRLLAAMPDDDLHAIGSTPARYIVMLATVMEKY